ncbi:MAG: NAD(P)H-hydrate dehydratase [Planctomycetota bacterium]
MTETVGLRGARAPASLPARPREAHKGTFGTVGIVAGSEGMLGAAILCARGALRGGAGLVRAFLPRALRAPFTVAVPAATTALRGKAAPAGCDVLVVGPGLGTGAATRDLVRRLVTQAPTPLVLDADALNVLAPCTALLRTTRPAVLTPHPGEAGRLLGWPTAQVQADRRAAVLALARRTGQVVVLKGAGTLVTDGRRLYRNTTGNPGLATGGSGDVLAGVLGALRAQGMDAFAAACLAVRVHGQAGDLVARRLSRAGLVADDLPMAVAEVLRRYER